MVGVEELFPEQAADVLALQREGERAAYIIAPEGPPPTLTSEASPTGTPRLTPWQRFWDFVYGTAPEIWDPVLDTSVALGETVKRVPEAASGILVGLGALGKNLVPLLYLGLAAGGLYALARLRGR